MLDSFKLKEIVLSQEKNLKKEKLISRELFKEINFNLKHAIVISGVRRCGKSSLLKQILFGFDSYKFLNFDDPKLSGFELSDFERLDKVFIEIGKKSNNYFFDEIQNVPAWEKYVRMLVDQGKKVFITGSNASLLSKELGTRLTGRHVTYELFPFSYKEFLRFSKLKNSLVSFDKFFYRGGFPTYLDALDDIVLQDLFNDILSRDVAVRNKIVNINLLKKLCVFLLTNVGKEFSYNKLKTVFNLSSVNTIIDYIEFFEDAYLLFSLKKFDFSYKKQVVSKKKIYAIDAGFKRTNSLSFTEELGRILENQVFLYLRSKFKEIYYFQEKFECDFVFKTDKFHCVQVCYDFNELNKLREIKGLIEALNFFNLKSGLIVTYDQEDVFVYEGFRIKLVPAYKFFTK